MHTLRYLLLIVVLLSPLLFFSQLLVSFVSDLMIIGHMDTRFPGNVGGRGKFHVNFLDQGEKKRNLKKNSLLPASLQYFPMNNVIYVITRMEKPGKLITYQESTADLETRGKFAGKGIKEIK